jgi:hypothetical protein
MNFGVYKHVIVKYYPLKVHKEYVGNFIEHVSLGRI